MLKSPRGFSTLQLVLLIPLVAVDPHGGGDGVAAEFADYWVRSHAAEHAGEFAVEQVQAVQVAVGLFLEGRFAVFVGQDVAARHELLIRKK